MLLHKERMLVVEHGCRLVENGLVKGTGGNLSIFNREEKLVAISPSGIDYGEIAEQDIPVVTIDGRVVEGRCSPSSEIDMHMLLYENRDDISALVHTHSPYATTIACLREDLPAAHYLIGFAGPNVRCASYAPFGSVELAEAALKGMRDRTAVLLANHGLLAGGASLAEAFAVAEMIEFCAEVYYRARSIGTPVVLSDEDMQTVLRKFASYGKQDKS